VQVYHFGPVALETSVYHTLCTVYRPHARSNLAAIALHHDSLTTIEVAVTAVDISIILRQLTTQEAMAEGE
jgi:hypothetical protein